MLDCNTSIKTIKSLFIIMILLLAGLFIGYHIKSIVELLIFQNYGDFDFTRINFIIWILGVIINLTSVIIGVYVLLVKGKTNNIPLFINMFFSVFEFKLMGNNLSWMFGGLGFHFEIMDFGMGINILGVLMLFCYFRIILLEHEIRVKQLVE